MIILIKKSEVETSDLIYTQFPDTFPKKVED